MHLPTAAHHLWTHSRSHIQTSTSFNTSCTGLASVAVVELLLAIAIFVLAIVVVHVPFRPQFVFVLGSRTRNSRIPSSPLP